MTLALISLQIVGRNCRAILLWQMIEAYAVEFYACCIASIAIACQRRIALLFLFPLFSMQAHYTTQSSSIQYFSCFQMALHATSSCHIKMEMEGLYMAKGSHLGFGYAKNQEAYAITIPFELQFIGLFSLFIIYGPSIHILNSFHKQLGKEIFYSVPFLPFFDLMLLKSKLQMRHAMSGWNGKCHWILGNCTLTFHQLVSYVCMYVCIVRIGQTKSWTLMV